MRKVLTSLLLLLFVAQLSAQSKAVLDAQKSLAKVKAEVANPKKSGLAATWVKLGTAYMECFDAPLSGVWQGASQMDVKLLLKDQPVLSTTQEEINGAVYTVDTYSDKALYYAENGTLAAWVVKSPTLTDVNALKEAYAAFVKANELDAKGDQNKAIVESMKGLQTRWVNEAMSAYTLGKNKEAADNFEESLTVSSNPLVGVVDSTVMYYTAFTATLANDNARATKYLEKCVEIGFDQNGDVYASLSNCYKAAGDTVKAKELLSTGFTKYPTSQSILVSLINLYMETNEEPSKLVELLQAAQKNEPTNASLYYAEGNIYVKLGDFEKGIAAYKKSVEVDPNYFWGVFSVGKTYYDQAVAIQEKANEEFDDAKYNELLKQIDASLESSIEPLEKAFTLTAGQADEKELKAYVGELLKNVYFRFREKNEDYKAAYEKYNTFLQQAE